jgi:uncharacterized protein (TIGR03663 family)
MRHRSAFLLLLLLLTVGALAFRLPDLGNRPFHGDEAVHAFKFEELWKTGVYRYDPNEYHGPTLYYATLPSVWLQGRRTFAETREADYRLPIALFGAALVLLLAPLSDGLGKRAILCAAVLTALSPAFVFYSRYYIQETLLAFFTLTAIICGWRFSRHSRPAWLLAAGIAAGLMVASKETAVLAFVAAGLALWFAQLWTRRVDKHTLRFAPLWQARIALPRSYAKPDAPSRSIRLAPLALMLGVLTACLFLSGFFTHLSGPLDYLRSYTPWLQRAHATSLHRYPWNYYLSLILWTHRGAGPVWSEGLIVGLALVGCVLALLPEAQGGVKGSVPLARFIAFYTIILTFIYSAIPYKTPWCILSFLSGMILLAGIGAASLVRLAPGKFAKGVAILLLLAGGIQLGYQSYRTSYIAYDDPRNPYVYAQPVPDVANLGKMVEEIANASPQHDQMVIKVLSVDNYYWPVPWYLRRFPNIGYYNDTSDPIAPVILASPEFDEELTKKLGDAYIQPRYYGIRSGVFLEVWVQFDLWKRYIETRPKPKEE